MTLNDLKSIKPIPGFNCVEMKQHAQERLHHETADMTVEELLLYCNGVGRAFRQSTGIPAAETQSAVLREEPSEP